VRRIILPTIALIALSSGAARAQPALPDAEIRDLVAGKSALFTDYSVATYGADGSYSYLAANNLYFRGTYTIAAGRLCLTLDNGQNRCDAVARDGQGIFLRDRAGQQLRFSARPVMTPQVVSTLCGVPVAYTVKPPAADVPAEIATFSGTWVGSWDYGMCAALIVESVWPDGAATVIYVNGAHDQKQTFKAGSLRFAATIKSNWLSDGGTTTAFDAVMKTPSELAAKRIGPPGAGTAQFTRQ
jgi:hypothetical protein